MNPLLRHLRTKSTGYLKKLFKRARIAERFEYGPVHITVFGFGRTRKHRREQEFYAKLNQVFYRLREAGVARVLDGTSIFVLYDWRAVAALAAADRAYLEIAQEDLLEHNALYEVFDDTIYLFAYRGFKAHTLVHELGHRFYYRVLPSNARVAWEGVLQSEVDVDTNAAEEAFADLFTSYVLGAAQDVGPAFARGRIGIIDPPWVQRLFKRTLQAASVRVNPYGDPKELRRYRRSSRRTHPPDLEGLRVHTALVRSKDFTQGPIIQNSDDINRLMLGALADKPDEGFYVVMLDGKNRVTGIYEAAQGTQTTVQTLPSSALRAAIIGNAHAVILVHNHPANTVEPSDEDIALTTRFKEAGKAVGIKILDHLIIGKDDFTSLAARGLL